jgi:hypothetical protein
MTAYIKHVLFTEVDWPKGVADGSWRKGLVEEHGAGGEGDKDVRGVEGSVSAKEVVIAEADGFVVKAKVGPGALRVHLQPEKPSGKTCVHGKEKGYYCGMCQGMAKVEQ